MNSLYGPNVIHAESNVRSFKICFVLVSIIYLAFSNSPCFLLIHVDICGAFILLCKWLMYCASVCFSISVIIWTLLGIKLLPYVCFVYLYVGTNNLLELMLPCVYNPTLNNTFLLFTLTFIVVMVRKCVSKNLNMYKYWQWSFLDKIIV